MKEDYYVNLRGQRYVLYKGLIAMAHERGLASIETDVIQIPTADNGNVAVVKAVVTISDIEEEAVIRHRSFSGIGDASPENTSKQMAAHVLRLAETRAKARALRDAIGEGVTALEELGEDAEPSVETSAKAQVQRSPEVPKETPKEQAEVVDKAGHKKLLERVESLLGQFPDGYFDDVEEKRTFAQRGIREAEVAVERLEMLLSYEQAKPGGPATEEKRQAPSGYAHDEQVELLTKYADQLYSERSKALSGSEWLLRQRKISSFHVLTKREAKDWIDEMREELGAKEGAKA